MAISRPSGRRVNPPYIHRLKRRFTREWRDALQIQVNRDRIHFDESGLGTVATYDLRGPVRKPWHATEQTLCGIDEGLSLHRIQRVGGE